MESTERSIDTAAWLSPMSYSIPTHIVESAWLRHGSFAEWLIAAHRPRTFVELGTHNGFSYFAMVEAARRIGLDMSSWAIDSWEGDEHAGFYGQEIYDDVSSINEQYADSSRLLRGYFSDMVGQIPDGTVDLLHIDGRHRYEDAKEDFELYASKLTHRGIVLFHDVAERENGFGVYRLWEELADQYDSFLFEHEHGLGVLFVGTDRSPEISEFIAASRSHGDEIRAAYNHLGSRIAAMQWREREYGDALTRVSEYLAELNAERAHTFELEQRLADIESSHSWKVTAPLRRIRGSRESAAG
jgi:predicted O-methyltransferase YrrM